jgi:hypothetical protein
MVSDPRLDIARQVSYAPVELVALGTQGPVSHEVDFFKRNQHRYFATHETNTKKMLYHNGGN